MSKKKEKVVNKIAEFKKNLEERMSCWARRIHRETLPSVEGIPDSVWDNESDIVSFPPSLSQRDRKTVHNLSSKLNLHHISLGDGDQRFISISRTGCFDELCRVHGPQVVNTYCHWYNSLAVKPVVRPRFDDLTEAEVIEALTYVQNVSANLHEDMVFRVDDEASMQSVPSDLEAWEDKMGLEALRPTIVVDQESALIALADQLNACNQFGFDCEMHHFRSYNGITCLIQICVDNQSYVVDTLALWDLIRPVLGPIFANPAIVKVGHSVQSMDVPSLFRDFGIVLVNVYDTQEGAQALSCHSLGLSGVLKHWKCVRVEEIAQGKEKYQHADWRLRPLPQEMLTYAAMDVQYLVPLYFIQVKQLLRLGHDRASVHRSAALAAAELEAEAERARAFEATQAALEAEAAAAAATARVDTAGVDFEVSDGAGDDEQPGQEGEVPYVWGTDVSGSGSSLTRKQRRGQRFGDDADDSDEELGLTVEDSRDLSAEDELGAMDEDDEDWDGWGVVVTTGDASTVTTTTTVTSSESADQSSSGSVLSVVPVTDVSKLSSEQGIGTVVKSSAVNQEVATSSTATMRMSSPGSISGDVYHSTPTPAGGTSRRQARVEAALADVYGVHRLLTREFLQSDDRCDELKEVFLRSAQACTSLWTGSKALPANAYLKIHGFKARFKSKSKPMTKQTLFVIKKLVVWRDEEARKRDESAAYICPPQLLLDAAERCPRTIQELTVLSSPLPPSMRPIEDATESSGVLSGVADPVNLVEAVQVALEEWRICEQSAGGDDLASIDVDLDDQEKPDTTA